MPGTVGAASPDRQNNVRATAAEWASKMRLAGVKIAQPFRDLHFLKNYSLLCQQIHSEMFREEISLLRSTCSEHAQSDRSSSMAK